MRNTLKILICLLVTGFNFWLVTDFNRRIHVTEVFGFFFMCCMIGAFVGQAIDKKKNREGWNKDSMGSAVVAGIYCIWAWLYYFLH